MASEIPSVAQIIRLLPAVLQRRFESLNGYVRGVIEEVARRQNLNPSSLSREENDEIQLAAFVFLLDRFFRTSSRAADSAAREFAEFGLAGFRVGSQLFAPGNENSLRGERLANQLAEILSHTRLGNSIRNASTVADLVERYLRERPDGRNVD